MNPASTPIRIATSKYEITSGTAVTAPSTRNASATTTCGSQRCKPTRYACANVMREPAYAVAISEMIALHISSRTTTPAADSRNIGPLEPLSRVSAAVAASGGTAIPAAEKTRPRSAKTCPDFGAITA